MIVIFVTQKNVLSGLGISSPFFLFFFLFFFYSKFKLFFIENAENRRLKSSRANCYVTIRADDTARLSGHYAKV